MIETNRWRGVTVFAFLAAGLGILLSQPTILLISVIGVGYAAYAQSTTIDEPQVEITRQFDAVTPEPGDEVTVTVDVTNVGDRLIPDLRLV
ncbi:MAG: DUF58 domain-containing protein, partial [Halobacteriaceae archaeon]